jgi:chromosomal replication initiator protein
VSKPVETFYIDRDPLDGTPIPPQPRRFGKQIIAEVAKETGISVADILGPRKLAPIAAARRIAMQRIRNELGYSYPQIGRMFGRDHSTAIWACRGGRRAQPYRSPEQRNAA